MKFIIQFENTDSVERTTKVKEFAAEVKDTPAFMAAVEATKPFLTAFKTLDKAHGDAAKSTAKMIPALIAYVKGLKESEEISHEAALRITRKHFTAALVRGGISFVTASRWMTAVQVDGEPLFVGRATSGEVKPFKDSATATAAVMKALEGAAKKGASLSDVLAAAVALNLPIGDTSAIATLLQGKI